MSHPLHHVFKRTWTPRIGQMLTTFPEDFNPWSEDKQENNPECHGAS